MLCNVYHEENFSCNSWKVHSYVKKGRQLSDKLLTCIIVLLLLIEDFFLHYAQAWAGCLDIHSN